MHKLYGFNPRRCNSASTLSSCTERDLSKVKISLSTNTDVVEMFEKILTGGFSCANIRLRFETANLLPKSLSD